MTTARTSLALVLVFLTASGSAFADQQHVVAPQQLITAMTEKVAAEDADRAAVREALARPQVREVAASMGVDMAKLTGAVETMSGDDLKQAASTARQVNEELVGGVTTIALTATTIIIILLVVIIIVLLAK
jgi:hypothetical protein